MYIKHPKDFKAGLLFIMFGLITAFLSQRYPVGTAAKMGPGYFPFLLGLILPILGAGICLKSLSKGKGVRRHIPLRFRPVLFILSSVVLFGLLLYPLGVILSALFLILISSIASEEFNLKIAFLNAFVLILVILVIFVYFLKFQIPILPFFFKGWI